MTDRNATNTDSNSSSANSADNSPTHPPANAVGCDTHQISAEDNSNGSLGIRQSQTKHPILRFIAMVWAVSLLLISLTRFPGRWSYGLDLVGNLSCLIILPGIITTLLLVALRRKLTALICLLATLIAAWPTITLHVQPYFFDQPPENASSAGTMSGGATNTRQPPTPQSRPPDHLLSESGAQAPLQFDTSSASAGAGRSPAASAEIGATLSIVEFNVHGDGQVINRLVNLVLKKQPDIVVAIEVRPEQAKPMMTNRKDLRAIYPFAVEPRPGQLWPFVMLSRYPMYQMTFHGDDERYKFVYAYRNSYLVDAPGGGRFILSADHPPSPRTAEDWAHGNDDVQRLCEVINKYLKPADAPILIAGDFNTTPNGWRFRLMHQQSGLVPSDVVAGVAGTWPDYLPPWMRITLDRIWASPNVRYISQDVLDDLGSDHLPILVTLQLPRVVTRSDIP